MSIGNPDACRRNKISKHKTYRIETDSRSDEISNEPYFFCTVSAEIGDTTKKLADYESR